MAEAYRTVRVSGLPTDIGDDTLKDKLSIHFLRSSNGGGEIDSVVIVKATPVSALITFEDSKVAQKVIQRCRHVLEVNGKKYKLTATEHRATLDPDQVILSLSAIVNYSQLPGGLATFMSVCESHQIEYDATEGCCTLLGTYSKVQPALAQLLGHPGYRESAENKDSGQPALSGSRSVQTAQAPHARKSEDQIAKPNKQRERRERNHSDRTSDEYNSSSNRDLTPGGYSWEDTEQTDGAALQPPTASVEDFSLIVDADVFQYLQKHCQTEYQHILSQYGVEVVEMTTEGLTSLFLEVATAARESGRELERLTLAKMAISSLCQENESKICRGQLPKDILSPRGRLQRAMESLSVRLPKLLLTEDDQNIYIIGSSSDVCEAKQFLLLDRGKEDVASLLRFPSYESGTSAHAEEERVPLTASATVGSLDDGTDLMLKSEEDERRAEGVRRYKLAARFKDSSLPALGSRPTDFTLRANSSPSRQTRLGPMLGHDVLSETAGTSGEAVSRAGAQNTGGDTLFKSGHAWPSSASSNPDFIHTRPKNVSSPFSTTQSSSSGSTAFPPVGSGSTLKRRSSFSGTPQQKAEVMSQRAQDDSSKSAVRARGRCSSFSDKVKVYNDELTVSMVMWQYIKEAYSTRVEDLTSDVQMEDRRLEGSPNLTITLRGASSSKVRSCQQSLQKLVDSVTSDFIVQELRMSELGVTDTADETLQACCSEVRSRFRKVIIQPGKRSLYFLGPQQLCSQVGATLREVFSGGLAQMHDQHHFSSPSPSMGNSPTSLQMNEDRSARLHGHSSSQGMLETQTGKADKTGRTQEWRTTYSSDFSETDVGNRPTSHVLKEKVKMAGTEKVAGQRAEAFVSHSTTGKDTSAGRVNGVGSTTTSTEEDKTMRAVQTDSARQRRAEIQNLPEESGQGGRGGICVCGENGTSVLTRTKCGATMCSKCLDTVHSKCRVCHETAQTPWGVQGEMKKCKLHMSVPGHNKGGAIKVTYCIPDGIQEEGHPSPGKPFRGGVFEAFLPDCDKSRKLLPRLEKAFRQGLTFTVTGKEAEARVTWDCIPHKTSVQGGKSGNGYPDSSYLTRLSEVLASHGIVEAPAKSQE